MARTALTATRLTEAGIDPTAVDGAAELTDGNSFAWAANRVVYILNSHASTALVVTVPTPGTIGRSSLAVGDTTINVAAAGGYKIAGPFGREYVQSDGTVHLDYSGPAADVTVAVLDAADA